jgi:hypothetical protein
MILVNLICGLGNQLFIAVAGYIAGMYFNCPVLLQKERDNDHNIHKHDYRKTILKHFGTPIDHQILPRSMFWHNDFTPWTPSQLKGCSLPVLLNGYYQHVDHILVIEEDIRNRILSGLQDIVPSIHHKYSHLHPNTTAFLHIRRGDYVPKSDIHYLQPISYYTEAYKQLCEKRGTPPEKLLIFSNDSAWVKEQTEIMSLPGAELITSDDELECMVLMSMYCHAGAICANSTFSWWGAFLGSHAVGSPIFVPERWIRGGNGKLFPDSWNIVKT